MLYFFLLVLLMFTILGSKAMVSRPWGMAMPLSIIHGHGYAGENKLKHPKWKNLLWIP